ncbi:DUF4385 domain-containing protein [Rhodocytophaga aerolata]|uniref:DUF4385 domain-containing protein n=1 Tax=Rhodocytophaga aerolata TaxID=455078 RepID=A0ABT8R878_9BACT|nr:DUF4385 domain-containing protein [Rhodocytophaga aerolata]MDO1448305.1 DUF4385 domain-containing protein [Rhodocytophaga aerolata]
MAIRNTKKEKRLPSYYSKELTEIDFRKHPELYRVGKGEQGVLMVEPYKSEILPYWKFKDPEAAMTSSEKIYDLFIEYLTQNDFVGADIARKFLQMGYTRARRYANHKSGRKYAKNPQKEETSQGEKEARTKYLLPNEEDPVKAAAAAIFKQKWKSAKENSYYQELMENHKKNHEQQT